IHLEDAEDEAGGGSAIGHAAEEFLFLGPDVLPATALVAPALRRSVEGAKPPADHATDGGRADFRRVLISAAAKRGGEKFNGAFPFHRSLAEGVAEFLEEGGSLRTRKEGLPVGRAFAGFEWLEFSRGENGVEDLTQAPEVVHGD